MALADAAPPRGTTLPASSDKPTSIRWVVCALLFFAATINYIDRNVLAVLKAPLTTEFGWTNTDFGYINFFFQVAYMVGMLASGWLIDKIGTRRGLAIAICLWSVAAMLHAEAPVIGSAVQGAFGALGLSMAASVRGLRVLPRPARARRGGHLPGSVRSIAEWFPQRERAFATGLFNAGTNIGALATPIIVPDHRAPLRLVLGLPRHRPRGLPVARRLALAVPDAAHPSRRQRGRTRADRK